MYNKTTEDVTVTVESVFLKEGLRPDEDMYLWAYRVRIENNRPESVHLCRRYWYITDSLGQVQEVIGIGVIGGQPLILSLAVYEYASGTILAAPSGMMMGSYEMRAENQKIIQVQVGHFLSGQSLRKSLCQLTANHISQSLDLFRNASFFDGLRHQFRARTCPYNTKSHYYS